MKRLNLFFIFSIITCLIIRAEEKPQQWDLNSCIEYALTHNIQLKQKKLASKTAQEEIKLAKAAYLPSLSLSTSQDLVHQSASKTQEETVVSSNYNATLAWTLFNGFERKYNQEQRFLQKKNSALLVLKKENDIVLEITQLYIQLLYAHETFRIYQETEQLSKEQLSQTEQLVKAGSLSNSELLQIKADYSNDHYLVIKGKTEVESLKLKLKQVLELEINEQMTVLFPTLNNQSILQKTVDKQTVYNSALKNFPEIKSGQLELETAKLKKKIAASAYLPTINMQASINTRGNYTSTSYSTQLGDNLNQGIGVSLSIPILNQRKTKTTIEKAKIEIIDKELAIKEIEKQLLKEIETIFLNIQSYQTKYKAALEKEKAMAKSYEIVQEEYQLGIKNSLDYLTQKNKYTVAQQEVLQTKYMTILNQQLLNFYQNKPIKIN